ncbi:MAG: hypothetical protein AVDCRST_MAG33-2734, partial [uncultured Thermomicrobiales bacterium]
WVCSRCRRSIGLQPASAEPEPDGHLHPYERQTIRRSADPPIRRSAGTARRERH